LKKKDPELILNVTKIAVVIVVFILVGALVCAWLFNLDYSQFVATIGLFIAASAFYGVIYNMNYNTIQLKKILAKPKLKLAFTEDGQTQKNIEASRVTNQNISLDLWVINDGDSIAKLFQIELEIPSLYNPHYQFYPEERTVECKTIRSTKNKTEILSLCNNEKIICFVNCPAIITDVKLILNSQDYDTLSDFTVHYKIFGDWGEPQTGELKVILKKQELSHAHRTG
jgi:hypothetical protein